MNPTIIQKLEVSIEPHRLNPRIGVIELRVRVITDGVIHEQVQPVLNPSDLKSTFDRLFEGAKRVIKDVLERYELKPPTTPDGR